MSGSSLVSWTTDCERLVRLLETRTRLFDAYARRSAVAGAVPDAIDISDTELARRIVEEEQEWLGVRTRGSWRRSEPGRIEPV